MIQTRKWILFLMSWLLIKLLAGEVKLNELSPAYEQNFPPEDLVLNEYLAELADLVSEDDTTLSTTSILFLLS
jgi:hypothetical protein